MAPQTCYLQGIRGRARRNLRARVSVEHSFFDNCSRRQSGRTKLYRRAMEAGGRDSRDYPYMYGEQLPSSSRVLKNDYSFVK